MTVNAETLADLAVRALERTAFVIAEPAETPAQPSPSDRAARIVYRGPSTGTVSLVASEPFLRELAASLLGTEPEEVDIALHGQDALKELTNIMGGSLILTIGGEQCMYSLGLPEVCDVAALGADSSAQCTLQSECGMLRILWRDEQLVAA